MESPFEVLLIDADADDEEIEQAYRERVKEVHPDQGGSVEEFRAVRTAYERIKAGYSEDGGAATTETTAASDATPDPRPTAGSERTAGTGATAGPDATTGPGATTDSEEPSEQPWEQEPADVTSEVTYLNYDVLADFGWETDDADLFEKASDADLDDVDYGRFEVEPGESLLEAAEDSGFAWPFACRGGACANCAILLREGELSMPASHVLPSDLMAEGIRLSCNGVPITAELEVVYNVKHMPELEDLLLPPQPFEQAYPDA